MDSRPIGCFSWKARPDPVGAEVEVVNDGDAALERVQSFRPAMVLLDLRMPGIDGYEVARRIRQRPEFRDVMLVALTGWGQEEDRRRSRTAGFDHHLIKPAGIDALRALVADHGKPAGRPLDFARK